MVSALRVATGRLLPATSPINLGLLGRLLVIEEVAGSR